MPINPPKREKGPGFLGTLERPDKYTSTELSIGVNIDGKEIEIPSLIPDLTKAETDYLLQGNKPTREIVDKAVQHARTRIAAGKSPFAGSGESNMPINAPRQLNTWLKGMQTRYTPGIQVPQLWGKGEEEYGIDYPLDVVPEEGTAGPGEAADILEAGVRGGTFRAPSVIRGPAGEEEFFGTVPPAPEPPSRDKVIEMFHETYGNPDTFDVEAETVKAMEEEDGEIRERLGIKDTDLKYVSPAMKKLYTQRRAEREKEVYTRQAAKPKRLREELDKRLKVFDAQMKEQRVAGQQARTEVREEERLGIARSAELRALGKPPTAKRVWDTKLDKYVQRTDAQITKEPDRYGMSKETALEMKKAGATTVTLEKYGLQVEATAGNIRTQLMANKRDKALYAASGKMFNITNTKNEIAYWKTVTPGAERQGVRIVKLTTKDLADGWTPKRIQEFADNNPPMTVEDVLNRIRAGK